MRTFEIWKQLLDKRAAQEDLEPYPEVTQVFLWQELKHKTAQSVEAIWKWLETGEKTNLELSVNGVVYSTKTLQSEFGMAYLPAVLTWDWILREPEPAIQALERNRTAQPPRRDKSF